jgi:Zn-dependent protease
MNYDFADGIKWYLVFLLSTSCHEAAHAWTAHRLGDDTAYRGGQVTLNPWPHIQREPFGMVLVPLLSYFMGGWMIGWASAPYDPQWALRYPKRSALMSLAGPAANLVLVICAAVLMRVGFEWHLFHQSASGDYLHIVAGAGDAEGFWAFSAKLLSLFFSLNLLLAAFNLLPVPPLDGSSLPLFFLSNAASEKYWLMVRTPAFSFLGLILAWRCFGLIYPTIFASAAKLLYLTMPGG